MTLKQILIEFNKFDTVGYKLLLLVIKYLYTKSFRVQVSTIFLNFLQI